VNEGLEQVLYVAARVGFYKCDYINNLYKHYTSEKAQGCFRNNMIQITSLLQWIHTHENKEPKVNKYEKIIRFYITYIGQVQ